MSDKPIPEGLQTWPPGVSGNPDGARRHVSKRMREALSHLVAMPVPGRLLDHAPEQLREVLPEQVTFAELAALRLALMASVGAQREALAASQVILRTENPDAGEERETGPPRLEAPEERRLAVARQLGLDVPRGTDAA